MSHASSVSPGTTHRDLSTADRSPSRSAVDTALLLFKASPAHAKNFALSMHEQAAWGCDTALIEHWADVVTELSRLGHAPRLVG